MPRNLEARWESNPRIKVLQTSQGDLVLFAWNSIRLHFQSVSSSRRHCIQSLLNRHSLHFSLQYFDKVAPMYLCPLCQAETLFRQARP